MSPRPSDLASQAHLLVFTTFGNVVATNRQKEKHNTTSQMNLPVLGRYHFHYVFNVVVLFIVVTNFTDDISHSRREFNYENAETYCLLVFLFL